MASTDDYDVPPPSKIKLKETKHDKAARVYRREQRRLRKESERISRANGVAVTPPPSSPGRIRPESLSPPRRRRRHLSENEETDDRLDREEMADKMAWMEEEEMYRSNPDPFASYAPAHVHIPLRHRPSAAPGSSAPAPRDAAREVRFDGGAVPPLGEMDEEEYAEWVREGMYRLKNRAEVEERERLQQEKAKREEEAERQRERARKEEKRRIKELERQKGRLEEDKRRKEREGFGRRWKVLDNPAGAEVQEVELAFGSIPWPVYVSTLRRDEEMDKEAVRDFLEALAKDRGEDLKRTLRETIRLFHPDRFFGRVLPRVREGDRERVREGVEHISRIINELASSGSV